MIELNKIYNESNCDTMSRMPDNFIDLTVTSPPYDNLRDYEGYHFDFERVAQELFRVTKQGGIVVWVVNDATINGSETLTSCKQKIYFRENCGFDIYDTMLYKKNTAGFPPSGRYEQIFEYVFVLSKGKPKTINLIKDKKNLWAGTSNFGERSNRLADGTLKKRGKGLVAEYGIRTNIWEYPTGNGYSSVDDIAFNHPAIFPEALAKDHILSWSNEREIVYDPFMGSGTVAKMCILTNRNYVGSEISQKYCDIAEKRILPYKQQIDIFYNAS